MNATQENTTTGGWAEERPRCRVGSKTDHPCWREATRQMWSDTPDYLICDEHYRSGQLAHKLDELCRHLDALGEWIATWDDPSVGETRLQYHAFTMRSKMLEEFWHASVKYEAARYIADQGPDEEPLSFEGEKRRSEVHLKSHAISDAHLMFEDLQVVPEEAFGSQSRWHLAAALQAIEEDVNAEFDRYRRERKA